MPWNALLGGANPAAQSQRNSVTTRPQSQQNHGRNGSSPTSRSCGPSWLAPTRPASGWRRACAQQVTSSDGCWACRRAGRPGLPGWPGWPGWPECPLQRPEQPRHAAPGGQVVAGGEHVRGRCRGKRSRARAQSPGRRLLAVPDARNSSPTPPTTTERELIPDWLTTYQAY